MLDRASRLSLQAKRALVTGASRGIGAEIAPISADAVPTSLPSSSPRPDFISGQIVLIDGGYSAV